ncbi:hypothetical protein [Flavobacterium sp. DG2-3]|uniref:hypothetical protein n=1 Tax=Flavobacterium sp. DG2-3 TaxID=3068317 RepID=UPI00273E8DAF|nr:hypothetical protein [Flavobacterium sp. DG2-3]MDP5200936.1 hypothetical protein [Flavobacterium sp. DG2-3]
MKNIIVTIIGFLVLCSCENKDKRKENIVKAIALDTLSKTVAGTANLNEKPVKDIETVNMIREQLLVLLKSDLPSLKKEERFFFYDAFDLNNDKKEEYFVGFSNSYFCGSGGCSGFILNNNVSLINKFSVTDFPILIAPTSTENFSDLLMKSGGLYHLVKLKSGKYPSNPSIEEKWNGEVPKESTKVLDIYEQKMEKYSF